MKAVIVTPVYNKSEKNFAQYLVGKVSAIGYETSVADGFDEKLLVEADVIVVVFDGRPLGSLLAANVGYFAGQKPLKGAIKRLTVGYEIARGSDQLLKKSSLISHLAKTELNLVACLKDYLFYCHRNAS